ncbi:MAG: hemolysin family protein [Candidatus Nanopelagicales bacterium]
MIEYLFFAILAELLAALFILIRTAIGRISLVKVEQLKKESSSTVDRLEKVVIDRAKFIAVLQFLALALSSIGAVLLAVYFVSVVQDLTFALIFSIIVVTLLSFIFLGVAPETLGLQHAERIAIFSAGLTLVLGKIFWPLVRFLVLIGNAITPGKGYKAGPFASAEELRELVDRAEADDLIEAQEREMIHSVFELGETFAKEVMVPRTEVVWIEKEKTLRQAISLALRSGYSRIPVIGEDADDVLGIVYLKDISRRIFENSDAERNETVESLMRQVVFVPDSKPVDDLLRDMQAARVHLAVVVDEYGGTAGLVTIEDILEEIVGEIADEYDTQAPEVTELGPDIFRVSSRAHVDDVADLIDLDLSSEDEGVDTIGGLLAKRLGKVPIPGASIDLETWEFTAERAAGRRNQIGTVLIRKINKPTEELI